MKTREGGKGRKRQISDIGPQKMVKEDDESATRNHARVF